MTRKIVAVLVGASIGGFACEDVKASVTAPAAPATAAPIGIGPEPA
jgi:hypothetical protein